MIWTRLPKMKKTYHSKAVPAQEAATTVRMAVTGMIALGAPSTVSSAMKILPRYDLRSNIAGLDAEGDGLARPRRDQDKDPRSDEDRDDRTDGGACGHAGLRHLGLLRSLEDQRPGADEHPRLYRARPGRWLHPAARRRP